MVRVPRPSKLQPVKNKLQMATAMLLSLPFIDTRWKRVIAAAAATGSAALGVYEAFGYE